MAFFEENESANLTISRMILHVVRGVAQGGNEIPFEAQEELPVLEAAEFFIKRVTASAASGVHTFNAGSPTKALIAEICREGEFEAQAQELSRRFYDGHNGQAAAGAFFVLLLECDEPDTQFVCLVKYDYRNAVELHDQDGRVGLRAIVQAFVADKKAIQKFCVARVRNGVVEAEVSASDRSGKSPDLTHYFQTFLDVKRERDTQELSRDLREVIRGTLEKCKDLLPNGNVPQAVNRVNDSLRGQENVNGEIIERAILASVERHDDEVAVEQLRSQLQRQIKAKRLEGVEFRPDRGVFRKPPKRRIKTQEGVEVTYSTSLEDINVIERPLEGGGREIVITTNNDDYSEDRTIRD